MKIKQIENVSSIITSIFVHRHNKGTEAAMKLRRQILHMHKWIYCGSVSTGIYKFLRKCKHALRGDL